jgi:hypothetical protein
MKVQSKCSNNNDGAGCEEVVVIMVLGTRKVLKGKFIMLMILSFKRPVFTYANTGKKHP